ncbi:helix-turn-helix domain-containing protein [Winogradskyella sp.]
MNLTLGELELRKSQFIFQINDKEESNISRYGNVQNFHFGDGIKMQIRDLNFNEEVKIIQLLKLNQESLVLDFFLEGEGTIEIPMPTKSLSNTKIAAGVFLNTTDQPLKPIFKSNCRIKHVQIILPKKWTEKQFLNELNEALIDPEKEATDIIFFRLNTKMRVVLETIFKLDKHVKFRRQYLNAKMSELVVLFFLKLTCNAQQDSEMRPSDLTRILELEDYINENLSSDLSVVKLARIAGFSRSKLQLLFRQLYDKSVHKKIQEIKMKAALEMLESNDFTISEIGYEMGYRNMSHFSAAFKKINGFLPSHYFQL